ncbi:MAG: methylthioribulose 1-phosphate dehydratase [Fimbriimonadales bacterium]
MKEAFVKLVHTIHARGWSPGTGGNYSYVQSLEPFRLVVSPSGIDKGTLSPEKLLVVDEKGTVVEGNGKPSAETLLHVAIAQRWGGKVIVHTHSIWNTIASLRPGRAFEIEGLEMLKALEGNTTHEASELVPVVDNSQDMEALSGVLADTAEQFPRAHGVLLRGHGLYTWGDSIAQAQRHLEAFEFLFEVVVRNRAHGNGVD